MKRPACRITVFSVLVALSCSHLWAQTAVADGTQAVRGNRLMSVRSEPGQKLHWMERSPGSLEIQIDGIPSEEEWQDALDWNSFRDASGVTDATSLRVLSDSANIFLFWTVSEEEGITATLEKDDGIITGDDYVQVNLRPWLPDEVVDARDYYYSLAVNPTGKSWDAYFDPLMGGYFYSSWDSGAEVVTSVRENSWVAEMRVPFSGLDLLSNSGWDWKLTFAHSSHISGERTRFSTAGPAALVRQGIDVRRKEFVDYYWTRPEFLEEVKPDWTLRKPESIRAAALGKEPAVNSRPDSEVWAGAQSVEIGYSDRRGEGLTAGGASAQVGVAGQMLFFRLEATGGKTLPQRAAATELGEGMKGQTAGVNGVFVDPALFADESFWIILQPRRAGADGIHEPFFLVLLNNRGEIRGTRYDQFGTPDRNWTPGTVVDVFDTSAGWGAEVGIALDSLDIPPGYLAKWGFNLFRNRLDSSSSDGGSDLQAWLFTGTDFLNPALFGVLEGIPTGNDEFPRLALRRRLDQLEAESAAAGAPQQLRAELGKLKADQWANLDSVYQSLEALDDQLGVVAATSGYKGVPPRAKGGHALLDVQFIGTHGWAVGAMGTILRTEDGGSTWESVELDHDADLYRVFFVDEQEGWAAGGRIRMGKTNEEMRHDERGGFGYIFHTSDGGRTWECQYGERGRHLFGLFFVDQATGFACGELGFLLKTEDGGRRWRELPTTGTSRWLYGLTFLDSRNGFAVGESETVMRTRDGGMSWTPVRAEADRMFYGFRPSYRDISFHGRSGCIVGQNGSILVSSDAGETWEASGTFVDPKLRELMDFTRVRLTEAQNGYAVAELGTRLMVTDDGGKSWTLRPVPNSDWLRAVWADSSGKVVVAGEREKILVSLDGATGWKTVRGDEPKADILGMLAHGDDAAIQLGAFYAHYGIGQQKAIVDVEVLRDAHSVEYRGEIYNLEHHRTARMSGVRTTTYFDEFENGNNGADYYHFTERLWEGERNVVRHMVAVIRAYRPDIVILHDPVFGDYDKPGHKLSGRAGIPAFETAGGETDRWPELTRLGLAPWQPKKLYVVAAQSYPATLDLQPVADAPLPGTQGTSLDWAEYAIRNFQSQGVYHAHAGKLSLVKSHVSVPAVEKSVFDGLE